MNSRRRLFGRRSARVNDVAARGRRQFTLSGIASDCLLEDRTLLATTQFAISLTGPLTAGRPTGFTITAQDDQGRITPDYAGTVSFSTSDSLATVPLSVNFAGGGGQAVVPTDSLILRVSGASSLTATDTANASLRTTFPFLVVPPALVTAAIQGGSLYVYGDAATDSVSLTLDDARTQVQVANNGSAVAGSPFASSAFSSIKVIGGTGAMTLSVDNPLASNVSPFAGGVQFYGGPGQNTLRAPDRPNTWSITGRDTGSLNQTVQFRGVANLSGSDSGDVFRIQDPGSVSGVIRGGLGGTTIDAGGAPLTIQGDVLTTGDLLIKAGKITLAPSVTLSTRQTAGDLVTGVSMGDSGSITLTAPIINLVQGDRLLAHVEPGSRFAAGDVTLKADLRSAAELAQFLPATSVTNTTEIKLTGTTIKGRGVSITAGSQTTNFYDDYKEYSNLASSYINNSLQQIPSLALSQFAGLSAQLVLNEANATIGLSGSSIQGSGPVTIASTAKAKASFNTAASTGTLTGQSVAISIGYGQATSNATTTLTDSVVTGAGTVSVTSDATTSGVVFSRIGTNIIKQSTPKFALSVSVVNTQETSLVTVSKGSTVQSTGANVAINSTGGSNNVALASPAAGPIADRGNSTAAALAVEIDRATIRTQVDGTVDGADGAPVATFNANPAAGDVAVNYADGTIKLKEHGFTDGQELVYSNGGALSIGGLTDGQTYTVNYVDADTIQLSNGPSISLSYNKPLLQVLSESVLNPQGQSFGSLSFVGIDPGAVDTTAGILTIASPSSETSYAGTPVDGDLITYTGSNSGASADQIGGLEVGKQYRIVPKTSAGGTTTVSLIDPVTRSPVVLTSKGVGAQNFLYESNVVYFRPTSDTTRLGNPARLGLTTVDSLSNTITFPTEVPYKTGDMVVYRVDPTLTASVQVDGQTQSLPDAPIDGLVDGQTYYVTVVGKYAIRLATTKAGAMAAAPITLTKASDANSSLGSNHTLSTPGSDSAVSIQSSFSGVNAAFAFSTNAPNASFITALVANTNGLNPEDVFRLVQSAGQKVAALQDKGTNGKAKEAQGGVTEFGFSIAGAVAVNYARHDVETIIGSTAVINSSTGLDIGASTEEYGQVSATAGATQGDVSNPESKAISVAVGVSIFENTAKAIVKSGAQLNSGGALGLTSTVSYPILIDDPNIAYNPATYFPMLGPIGIGYANDGTLGFASNLFNTFVVSTASDAVQTIGGAFSYNQYDNDSRAILEGGALVNQADDSFLPSPRFRTGSQSVSVTADTDMTLINVVGIGALSLNIDGGISAGKQLKNVVGSPLKKGIKAFQEIVNPFGASGTEGGVGASLEVDNIRNTTLAEVQGGAVIYTSSPNEVRFDGRLAANVSGNWITTGEDFAPETGDAVIYHSGGKPIGGLRDGQTYYAIVDDAHPGQIRLAATPQDATLGNAIVLDGSKSSGKDMLSLPDLIVSASAPIFNLAFAEAGAGGSGFGIAGSITVGIVTSDTTARIGSGTQITSDGGIAVNAVDDLTRIGIVGGVAKSQSVGVGVSLGINIISRDTAAYIGSGYDAAGHLTAPGDAGTSIVSGGPISVGATTAGNTWSAAIAGAVATQPAAGTNPRDDLLKNGAPPKAQKLLGIDPNATSANIPAQSQLGAGSNLGAGPGKASTSLAAAGAATINIVTQSNTRAFINDLGAIQAGSALGVRARDDSSTWALTGAVAANTADVDSSKSLAGAIGINIANGDVRAFLAGPTVTVTSDGDRAYGTLVVTAERNGGIRSLTAGGSGATNINSTSVAGSVSVNAVLGTVLAGVSSAVITASDTTVQATDTSDIWAIAGAVAYGGKGGYGVSIAVNLLGTDATPNLTQASISDARITGGAIRVQATNANPDAPTPGLAADPRIIAITGAIGANTNATGVAGAGMVSVNIISRDVVAKVDNSSILAYVPGPNLQATRSPVDVNAADSSGIISIGGAIALGTGKGVGAAIGYNQIQGSVTAALQDSSVSSPSRVGVTADAKASILALSAGVAAGGGTELKAAGSATLNIIQDNVSATIRNNGSPLGKTLTAAGAPVVIKASDTSSIISVAGGVGASAGGTAAGIALAYNLIQNTVRADTQNVVIQAGSLVVQAASSPSIFGIAAGAAASNGPSSISGAGSIAINSIADIVDARIGPGTAVTASGDVTVVATQSAPMVAVSGGFALGGNAALAGAFSYNYIGAGGNALNPNAINNPSAPGGSLTFDPTFAVDNNAIEIPGQTNNGLIDGQALIYRNADPGTQGITGLTEGATYYVIVKGPNSFQLAATYRDALAGNAIAISGEGMTSTAVTFTPPSGVNALISNATVNTSSGSIYLYGGLIQPGVTPAPGIAADTPLSSRDVARGTSATFDPATAVTSGSSRITLASTAGFTTGQAVVYHNGGGGSIGTLVQDSDGNDVAGQPLQDGGVYYIVVIDSNTIALSTDYNDATSGNPQKLIRLSVDGTTGVNHSLSVSQINALSGSTTLVLPIPVDLSTQLISVTVSGALTNDALAVAGSVSLNFVRNTVDVGIQGLAGDQFVLANKGIVVHAADASRIISIAGGVSVSAGQAAVGGAIAYNDIQNIVSARIGSPLAPTSSDPDAVAEVGGNAGAVIGRSIDVASSLEGSIVNVTFNLALSSGQTSVSGAGSINRIDNTADAHIANSTSVNAVTGINIDASNRSSIVAIAGGASGSAGAAVGAGLGYNEIDDSVLAFVEGSSVFVSNPGIAADAPGGSLAIAASSTASIVSVTLGVGIASNAGVAGSGAGNVISNLVAAFIGDRSNVTATGSVTVAAESANSTQAYGGSLGFGSAAGLGGAFAVNALTNKTHAYISGQSSVQAGGAGAGLPVDTWGAVVDGAPAGPAATGNTVTESIRGIAVTASTTETINNITGAAGLSSGGAGIGLNLLVNVVTDETLAYLDSSTVTASNGGRLIVRAHGDTRSNNAGGAVGIGVAGGAAGINVDVVNDTVKAQIKDTQKVNAAVAGDRGVEVSALRRADVTTTAIGLAVGTGAIAGSASGVSSGATVQATIDGAKVTSASGPIAVAANNGVSVTLRDGAGSAGVYVGAGGAIAVAVLKDNVSATIANDAVTQSGGDTSVQADSAETIRRSAGTVAISGVVGIGGVIAVASVTPTITARIDGSQVTAQGAVRVIAQDDVNMPGDVLGAVGVGLVGVGAGFTVDVITVQNTVTAAINNAPAGGQPTVRAKSVDVQANGKRTLSTTGVAFGAGGAVGVNGAVTVINIGTGLDSRSVAELGTSQASINNTLKGGGTSGIGTDSEGDRSLAQPSSIGARLQSAFDANPIAVDLKVAPARVGSTTASIGAGAVVEATGGDVTVSATQVDTVTAQVGGGALSVIAAAGASVGIAKVSADVEAFIAKGATVSASGDVSVTTSYSDVITVNSYGAQTALGGALGVVYTSVTDDSVQTSYIAGKVTQANRVIIAAQAPNPLNAPLAPPNHVLSAYNFGYSGAAISATGDTVGSVTHTGVTSAYLDSTAQIGTGVTSLSIEAVSGTLATNNMLITSAAGLLGVRANSATVTISPTIDAHIGANLAINLTGGVSVSAISSLAEGHTEAKSFGGAVINVGAGSSTVTTSPTVKAYIDQGTTVNAGGSIFVAGKANDRVATLGDPKGTFNPSRTVNLPTSTIAHPVPLSTGTEVEYQADPTTRTPIGGLFSRQVPLTVSYQPGSGGDQILLPTGQVWATYGFVPGLQFTIVDPADAAVSTGYTVKSVNGRTLTVTAANVITAASNRSVTFNLNRVYRVLNPSVTAANLTFANDSAGNTITRPDGSWIADGFVAGTQVTITGPTNRGTFTVKSVTDGTLTLTNTAPWAASGLLASEVTLTTQGAFRLGGTFDASLVNTANDSITFASPHNFQNGDAVRLGSMGNTPVGNLATGTTYYVRKLDDYTIQLIGSPFATDPILIRTADYNAARNTFLLPGLGNSSTPVPVTYRAPTPSTFYGNSVNITYDDKGNSSAAPNTILLPSGGVAEGAVVTYTFTGSVSPIVGLVQGQQYGVRIQSTNAKAGTSNIQLYLLNDPARTPITLTLSTDSGAKAALMTLTRQGFGPLSANLNGRGVTLVDGNTYLAVMTTANEYQILDPESGQVFTGFNTGGAAWNASAVHSFTPGVIQLTPSAGTQSLYLALSSAPDQSDTLSAVGGASVLTLVANTGSGVSTATASGGGAGVGQFSFPNATLTARPVVWAYSAASNLTAGGAVAISATSSSNVSATASNGGGGLLAVGQVSASVTQHADTQAFVGKPSTDPKSPLPQAANQTIRATSFILVANSFLTSYASARSVGGGSIAAVVAHTSDRVSENTLAVVSSGTNIVATGMVDIQAGSLKTAETNSYTYVVGIGSGANSDQQDFGADSPSGVNVGTATPATASVVIGGGASVTGQTVSLRASQSSSNLKSTANATAFSPILIGVAVAQANANVVNNATASVRILSGASITGTQGVNVLSTVQPANVTADANALAVAVIPVPIRNRNTPDSTRATIQAEAGALVTAGVRASNSPLGTVSSDTSGNAVSNVALNVQAYVSRDPASKNKGFIDWNADANILGGQPLAYTLNIDKQGNVTRNNGFDVNFIAGYGYTVRPIATPGNSIYFYGQEEIKNASAKPTFTFAPRVVGSLTIINQSDNLLDVGTIDVTALGARPQVYLDGPNLAIVSNTSPFNFTLATSSAAPSIVDIESTGTSKDLVIESIYNPIGRTILKNTSGNIVAGSQSIWTNVLDIVAGGTVGSSGPIDFPLDLQMIQYRDDAGVSHEPFLNVSAGGDVILDVTARQRNGRTDPVILRSSGISAGGNIKIIGQQGLADGLPTTDGGGVVVKTTQQGKSGTYNGSYFADTGPGAPSNIEYGLFGTTGSATPVSTTYSFLGQDADGNVVNVAGLTAGGNVSIAPSASAATASINVTATLNLNPVEGARGTVSVTAYGNIYLQETVGTMRVGTITSTLPNSGSITLAAFGLTPGGDEKLGLNIVMASGSSITTDSLVSIQVQDDFTFAAGATIKGSIVRVSTDTNRVATVGGEGSNVLLAGLITARILTVLQTAGDVPLRDTITITNVQAGTIATISMAQTGPLPGNLANRINVGDPSSTGATLSSIAGSLRIIGSGLDELNLNDSGDTTAWTGANRPTITSTNVLGMGMGTSTGVAYSGLSFLNLNLGLAAQTVSVLSAAPNAFLPFGTITSIYAQVGGNTWNVGSLAPTTTGGTLAGVQGVVFLRGVGTPGNGTDTLNIDNSGSTASLTGSLSQFSINGTIDQMLLTGLGMGTGRVIFTGTPSTLNLNLGQGAVDLQGQFFTDLPRLTTINGSPSNLATFTGTWTGDFRNTLNLNQLGGINASIQGEFYGNFNAQSSARINSIGIGGSVNVGSRLSAFQIDNLDVGNSLLTSLVVPGYSNNRFGPWALGTARIGGTIPQGILLQAGSLRSLVIGDNANLAGVSRDLAGRVLVTGNADSIAVGLGSVTTLGEIIVGGDLGTLTIGPDRISVGQNMAGNVNVTGTLGTARIAGGTPGLFRAGRVGSIGAHGGYGQEVLNVIEAGVQRMVDLAAPGQFYLNPDPGNIAASSYVNVQYLYESLGFANPQLSARVTRPTALPDRFDLSTIVLRDGGIFNVARIDAVGNSGLRNIAVSGSLIPGVSTTAAGFFGGNASPGGVYLPDDRLAGVAVRDFAPRGSIVASSIQAVAFGSFLNGLGRTLPGSQSTSADAAALLVPGTAIVPAGSVDGSGTETFRVPFAALPGQAVAFYLNTAGASFDPNSIVFTLQPNGDGVNPATNYAATRGAVTAMISAERGATSSVVRTVDLFGDGGSIFSKQFIADAITSTGPLGDVTSLAPQGLNHINAPSIYGNIAAAGPLSGTIQTTGTRTDPVTGATSTIAADLGRAYVVQTGGRTLTRYVTTTTIQGQGANSFRGRILSRGNLISSVRSDGGGSGTIAVQGHMGAVSTLLTAPTRVGGLLVNGGFSGQVVVLGNAYGDFTFHGGLNGGRIAVKGAGGSQSGILGNVIVDRGLYKTGAIGAGSAIVSGGQIGDATFGTALSVTDGNQGIIAARGALRSAGTLGGFVFSHAGSSSDPTDARAIDALFTDGGAALGLDLPNQPLRGLELLLEDLAALNVNARGKLAGPRS